MSHEPIIIHSLSAPIVPAAEGKPASEVKVYHCILAAFVVGFLLGLLF